MLPQQPLLQDNHQQSNQYTTPPQHHYQQQHYQQPQYPEQQGSPPQQSPYVNPSPTNVSPYANPNGSSKDTAPSYDYNQPQAHSQPFYDQNYSNYRSTADPTLPITWEVFYDTEQRPYYCNMSTGITQWAHPTTGHKYSQYAPSFEVPDYYTAYQQQQTSEFQNFQPHRPDFNPETSTMPDTSSPYNPNYYNHTIEEKTDQNVLNQAQLDNLSPKWIDIDKYTQNLTCAQRICGTMAKNKCLTTMSILLWVSIIVGLFLALIYFPKHPSHENTFNHNHNLNLSIAVNSPAMLCYFIYFSIFIIPAGFFPLFWLCCGCSPCLSDKPVETLRAKANSDTSVMKSNIEQLKAAAPLLVFHVECYHYETHTEFVDVTNTVDGKTVTTKESRQREEKVTTYSGNRQVPIIRFRDLSASELTIADISEQCPSNVISVHYNYVYELHPLQQTLLNQLKSQYYYTYCWYDDHCNVSTVYSINGVQPDVDVVVKARNCSYYTSRIFCFNPVSFFVISYATLLLPFMMAFRTFVRPIPFANVKYLHIGIPSPGNDVTTYSAPRWHIKWSFW